MRCLIVSNGPAPVPEQTAVEGGGLRCWGLAKGISAADPTVQVTIAYNAAYRKEPFTSELLGIEIRTYTEEGIADLATGFDSVIVSYCMGSLTMAVVEAIQPNQQLVLDCYVPIYVEASARQTAHLQEEYKTFEIEIGRLSAALKCGDLFLCANDQQKRFYQGVLAALGKINPATYGEDPILIVPYGIDQELPVRNRHAIDELIGTGAEKFKKILWFGGIYPWFDPRSLVEAAALVDERIPSKLVIVGARNPFVVHPDFLRQYEELREFIEQPKFRDLVVLQDWVRFEDRADWYLDADIAVLVNRPGLENELSWRTRLVDFVWGGLAVATNAGDPVGEMLIKSGAVARLESLEPESIANDLFGLLAKPDRLESLREKIKEIRAGLYWEVACRELALQIQAHKLSRDQNTFDEAASHVRGKLAGVSNRFKHAADFFKEHGAKETAKKVRSVLGTRRAAANARGEKPRIVFISHRLDFSGAPFVFMDLAIDLKKKHSDAPLEFFSFYPAASENLSRLNRAGIRPQMIQERDGTIAFRKGDVVVLNTVAHRRELLEDLFGGLSSGQVEKLYWYVHEDQPEQLFKPALTSNIKALLAKQKIEFWCVAKQTMGNYQGYFGIPDSVHLQPYRLEVPARFQRSLSAVDFHDKVRFILSGTVEDGRKGQLPILYAFLEFYRNRFVSSPGSYREFELVFVGLEDDFLSTQIRHHSSGLDGRVELVGKVSRIESLERLYACNFSICYSLRESLPMSIFEGMAMGHPLLRNSCSGLEEQLMDGVNGFLLPDDDLFGVAEVIERVLNTDKTSDEALAAMSSASHGLAAPYAAVSYEAMIEAVVSRLRAKQS